jgi:transposase
MKTTQVVGKLFVALELGCNKVLLTCSTQPAENPRRRSCPARGVEALLAEIAKAKERFGLPADAPVHTCYEAGRDGFWLHRALARHGILNLVVDSSSLEANGNRRAKRPKTDRIDAGALLRLLHRHHAGEKVWSVVNVPSSDDEDRRSLHRCMKDLQRQQTACSNRIKGLLAGRGLDAPVDVKFRERLDALRDWDGQPMPAGLRQRILLEYAVWKLLHRQIADLRNEQERLLRKGTAPWLDKIRRLMSLKAIGIQSAWVFVLELFAWREVKNGKELGALVGLTPTPYDSGKSRREQGISKSGNKHVRHMVVEIAWMWLRLQPRSKLSLWFQERFGVGGRARKIGIVALARKLLVALWRYVEKGEVPEGAEERDWRLRVARHGATVQPT